MATTLLAETEKQDIISKSMETYATYTTRKLTALINKTDKEIKAINKEIQKKSKDLEIKQTKMIAMQQSLNLTSKPLDEIPICQEIRARINAMSKSEKEALMADLETDIRNCNNDEL